MDNFSAEEKMVVMLYNPGNRQGLISELHTMKKQLTPSEKKLTRLADSILQKLEKLSDADFDRLDFYP